MPTQNKKIIIIDDDEIISEMYATKFSLEGFEVKTYTNGIVLGVGAGDITYQLRH